MGHGELYIAVEQANQAIEYTIQRLESILNDVRVILTDEQPYADSDITSNVAKRQGGCNQYPLAICTVSHYSAISVKYFI